MEIVRLRSGREVVIRSIRPSDASELEAAYDRLSPQSKYLRFLAPKPHLSGSDTRYLVHVDGVNHFALVATTVGRPERILGVARFVRLAEDPQTAEFAIAVGDHFQQEGLGSELMERLAQAASARGIARFQATVLAENAAAHRLVRGLPGHVVHQRNAGTVNEFEIELPAVPERLAA